MGALILGPWVPQPPPLTPPPPKMNDVWSILVKCTAFTVRAREQWGRATMPSLTPQAGSTQGSFYQLSTTRGGGGPTPPTPPPRTPPLLDPRTHHSFERPPWGGLKRSARAVQLFGRLAVLETHTLRY